MTWLSQASWLAEIPAIPLGGSVGIFIGLLVWLIKRGDVNMATTTLELRTQRDEALKRERHLQSENQDLRQRVNRAETELVLYRRLYGPLDGHTGELQVPPEPQ